MKILVTGAAGFIGSYAVKSLLERGCDVLGLDSINSYYDINMKYDRLAEVGVKRNMVKSNECIGSVIFPSYRFVKMNITDRAGLEKLFRSEKFDIVINLAAQAGVRYSIENPYEYIETNVTGFINILENCRHYPVRHLVYASSSSVYGMNDKIPYNEADKTESPISLYAATKKSNELMAHAYSNLYGIPTTGVRFFTVYGPWGRPDMAPFIFMKSIMEGSPIKVFNHGHLRRDFTYIDDVIEGLMKIVDFPSKEKIPFNVYNIGNSSPVELMHFITVIENVMGKKAVMNMMDMQPGDVLCTYADTTNLEKDLGYKPSTSIETGIEKFYRWYKNYISCSK